MNMDVVKTLEECVLDIKDSKIRLPKRVRLELYSNDGETGVWLGSHPVLKSRSTDIYKSMADYMRIKSAIEMGNYMIEFDENLNPHLEIL